MFPDKYVRIPDIQQALDRYASGCGRRLDPHAALIDMDGVLYDSMPRHAEAWMRMTGEIGMECDPDEFFLYEGMTGKATIELLMRKYFHREATAGECARLYARKTELFSANPSRPVMAGAQNVLKALWAFGLARVLVTGSGQKTLIDALSQDFPGVFTPGMIVSAADVAHGKPSPEPYERGLAKAACEPWQALVVENAPLGVRSGHDAGCFVCAVATGPVPRGELFRAGADLVFGSMTELAGSLPVLLRTAETQAVQS